LEGIGATKARIELTVETDKIKFFLCGPGREEFDGCRL
jgi:hypothetical protein